MGAFAPFDDWYYAWKERKRLEKEAAAKASPPTPPTPAAPKASRFKMRLGRRKGEAPAAPKA
ncbi:MAG TPA: hypothetical protein VM681_09560, partial [Candidatus Thermoplasmatota archaeon]|nr:hypothetical protein [Candidatus Thermoplasmatota archaeon]